MTERGLRIAGAWALVMAAACSAGRDEAPAAPALRPVTLPALMGADEDAVRQLRAAHDEAVMRAPDAAAYGRLGALLMAAELNDAAEPALLNALALAPNDPAWTYYLAHVYRRRGELATAAAYFERTLSVQPRNVAALWWLGTVHVELGRPQDAEPRFSEALALQPGALSAVYGLGRAALARGDYAGAAAHFERVLAMNPAATAAHYPLGLAYRGLGRLQEAEAHLARRSPLEILPIDPLMNELETLLQSATAYQDRAMRAAQSGDWQSAANQFRRAVELEPDNTDARVGLAMALAEGGDRSGAADQAREALRRAPGHPRARALMEALTAGGR
jgi:tetratricopeptide (TPR) repeat protein